ncbi:MAG: glycogen synthase GlgA [Bacteroidota bacterium]
MNVAIVASECAPFAKTGGLADVIGALPKYLGKLGVDVKVFIPKYDIIDEKKHSLRFMSEINGINVRVAGNPRTVFLHTANIPGSEVLVYFIDCREYFFRGKIYTDDWDEDERWILFNKAVIETIQRLQWKPDVIHCNDWQTGLLPLLVKDNYGWDRLFDHTSFLYSIHNIGYQGRFSHETLVKGELRSDLYYPGGPLEYQNTVCMMKAGIVFSETINTVSETYAREILTDEYGAGMQHILRTRERDLHGILNGIDTEEWNPETDKYLPFHYSKDDLSGKLKNKKYLLEKTTIPFDESIPLIGIISRLVEQKGFDLIYDAIQELMTFDARWVILGSGHEQYERLFKAMSRTLPKKCWAYIGFNNELAHLIEAGADMFLMPSHYEPCGLNQMYSLRYGTVPIVRKTGGLADTVQDWHEYQSYGKDTGDGFSFNDISGYALTHAIKRAIDSFHIPDEWKKIQRNGMTKDFSWENSARKYIELYNKAISQHR